MSSLSGTQPETATRPEIIGRGVRPDVALLQKAQRGDRAAYGQVVVLYQDRLFNAVVRMVGDRDEARELTQEAFTRGLMNLNSFRGDASPYTWLFRIAVNPRSVSFARCNGSWSSRWMDRAMPASVTVTIRPRA